MNQQEPLLDDRQKYEHVLRRAMAHAERHLPRPQAFEVAHDVALDLGRRPSNLLSGALIYIAVTSRLRNMRRSTERRAAFEAVHAQMREMTHPAWTQPGAEMEVAELRARIDVVIEHMPPGMRSVFRLVRDEEFSYKEAAEQLAVSVATVHTQLSRANALLRECVEEYHTGTRTVPKHKQGQKP